MTLTDSQPPTPRAASRKLTAFFNIEPGEEKLIGLLILLHFVFTLGIVFLQSMAFSVFIAEYSVKGLPYSYISIALIASLVALLYIRIGGRVPFATLLLINFLFITLTSLLVWLAQVKEARRALEDTAGLAQALIEIGSVMYYKSEYTQARELLNDGLALARQAGDRLKTSQALNALANVAVDQGDYAEARALYEESLALQREVGAKVGIADLLNNMGLLVTYAQGDYTAARAIYEESLALSPRSGTSR